MDTQEVLEVFRECDAILEGHFILTSGLHSPVFLQKARVYMFPEKLERLCKALAQLIQSQISEEIDYVVGPAIGGIIPAYETSRHLGVPNIWVERENGIFVLKRFEMKPNAKVVIVEDIVTTGLSINETVTALEGLGANVLAAACLVDRSAGEAKVGVPLLSLAKFKVPTYDRDNLPAELQRIPAIKPGSRNS